jgi:hypothetical protein
LLLFSFALNAVSVNNRGQRSLNLKVAIEARKLHSLIRTVSARIFVKLVAHEMSQQAKMAAGNS